MKRTPKSITNILYLIYDGDCILCRNSAQALKIKKTVGQLEIINARGAHPLVTEAVLEGYDLNEGILVKFNNHYYYGPDALHFLALISSTSGFFNKLNSFFFTSKWCAVYFYPLFKFIRNILLFFKKTPPIMQAPKRVLGEMIYGRDVEKLPKILQKRYSNNPYSKDNLVLIGEMNISISKIFRLLSPLFIG